MSDTQKDRLFMRGKDLILLVIAITGFYFGFVDRKISEAQSTISRAEFENVSRQVRMNELALVELKTTLTLMSATLLRIEQDLKTKVDK